MAGKQINFTKKTVETLPSPTKSVRAYYRDTKETGVFGFGHAGGYTGRTQYSLTPIFFEGSEGF